MKKNKKEKKYRFNFIDAVLLLIILACVAAVVWFVFFEGRAAEAKKNEETVIEYTLSAKGLKKELRDKVMSGEAVFDAKTKEKIGDVTDIDYLGSTYSYYDSGREAVVSEESKNLIDVEIKIHAKAEKTEDGTLVVGSQKIVAGSRITFRTQLFETECVCVSFREINN